MALGFYDGASTPEQLARRRAELDFLASGMGRAQNVGQGVGDILRGVGVGLGRYRANKTENAGIADAQSGFDKIKSYFNPFSPSQPPAQAPQVSGGAAFPNPAIATPQAPQTRLPAGMRPMGEPAMGAQATAGAVRPSMPPQAPQNGFMGQSVAAAGKGWTDIVGPDGKVVRREGSRNWRNNNPGNLEFGDFARTHGAIGTDGRFAVFPSYEAGRKAKEELLFNSGGYRGKTLAQAITRYAPQFENNTSGYINQVAQAAGVSPFTPLSQLNPQQRTAMLDAMQRVEGFKPGRETIGGQPVQMASNDPQGSFAMPASAPPEDMAQAQPIPQPMQQQPQQIAQAQPQTDNSKLQQLWEFANSRSAQFLPPNQKAALDQMLQMEMQKQDPAYKMKMEGDQLGLEKQRLELEQMRHPDQVPMTPLQKLQLQKVQQEIDNGNWIEFGGNLVDRKTMKPVFTPPPKPPEAMSEADKARIDLENRKFTFEQTKKPADVQEYQSYKDDEIAAGRKPVDQWTYFKGKVPSTTVNVGGSPSDDELRKKLQGKEGEAWAGYAEAATVSGGTAQDMQILDELIKVAPQGPVTGRLAQMFPGVSSAGAAFQSVVKRVAPTLRAPGSGSTSDIEYDGMLQSLPSLVNAPEANLAVSQVMKAKAAINIERGRVIAEYSNGTADAATTRARLNEINKRSIMTPEMKKMLLGLGGENTNQRQTKAGLKWSVEP